MKDKIFRQGLICQTVFEMSHFLKRAKTKIIPKTVVTQKYSKTVYKKKLSLLFALFLNSSTLFGHKFTKEF